MSDTALVWFRRDLRVRDQPTFLAARDAAKTALALFVLDPALLDPAGAARRTYLYRSLRALDASLGGRLLVVRGDPAEVVPEVAKAVDAATVHVAADFGPYGSKRDEAVAKALAEDERELVRTGSPYAVAPGRVRKDDGDPFKVFTPFRRAWAQHGWRKPADTDADTLEWQKPSVKGAVPIPDDESLDAELPEAGEDAAHERWRDFLTARSRTTGPPATGPTSPAPPACRCTSSTGRSTRGRCWPTSPGAGRSRSRPTAPRSRGASSTPTSSTSAPTPPAATTTARSTRCRSRPARRRRRRSTPGARAAPASRSSTPGCGSSGRRRGCTTGCG